MKYSFCYTIKKIITKDEKNALSDNQHIKFKNDNNSEITIYCGPWYNTKKEAKEDEILFQKDPDAFFQKTQGTK